MSNIIIIIIIIHSIVFMLYLLNCLLSNTPKVYNVLKLKHSTFIAYKPKQVTDYKYLSYHPLPFLSQSHLVTFHPPSSIFLSLYSLDPPHWSIFFPPPPLLYLFPSSLSLGVKFIVVTDKNQQKVTELLRKIYELYSDYVLKNPFYSLDMPIK